MLSKFLLVLALSSVAVYGFPGGAPNDACGDLRPRAMNGRGHNVPAQPSSSFPFSVSCMRQANGNIRRE